MAKKIIVNEVHPIKSGEWKDLSTPVYKESEPKEKPIVIIKRL